MGIYFFKPYTPSTRHTVRSDFSEITKSTPEKKLIIKNHSPKGRNNQGRITIRHKGGGHKKRYRKIDFKRRLNNYEAKVIAVEYDPNRTARIALLSYQNGIKRYTHPLS